MSLPRVTKKSVDKSVDVFLSDLNRAKVLYDKIVVSGYTDVDGKHERLTQPDTRDAAQFILFEIAAKFEDFATKMFSVEVRSKLRATVEQSYYLMGDLDNGIASKLGWGSPEKLKKRGKNVLSANSFFGTLDIKLGTEIYKVLIDAHKIRNRIAHTGGTAQANFVKLLKEQGLPPKECQGMSVGRFIKEYPSNAPQQEKYFYKILNAYRQFACKCKDELLR